MLPTTADWSAEKAPDRAGNTVDAAFTILTPSFRNFHFGKSMRAWLEGVPGFGPCLAFNAECNPGSAVEVALSGAFSRLCLVIDKKKIRMIPRGVGYYHGPKGQTKSKRRTSDEVFEFIDPRTSPTHDVFLKELNLDFKFALAFEEADGVSAKVPLRDFYHGRHPMIGVSFNLHLQLPKAGQTPLTSWAEVERGILSEIGPFTRFLESCTKLNKLTDPYQTEGFSGWSKTDPPVMRMQTPSHPLFLSRVIGDDPMLASELITGLLVTDTTYPPKPKKDEVVVPAPAYIPKKGAVSFAQAGSLFYRDDSSSEADSDPKEPGL